MKLRKLVVACIACYACLGSAVAALPGKSTRVPAGVLLEGKTAPAAAGAPVQSEPVDLPALSPQQIVDKNVAARGGLDAWKRVQTMSLEGKLDAGRRRVDGGRYGMLDRKLARAAAKAELKKTLFSKGEDDAAKIIQLPFKMEMKRPLQTRVEVEFQGKTAVQVYDGANGWKLRPYIGRHEVEAFSSDELKAASQQQELDGPLIDYAAKGSKVALAGTEMVEGRGAYKLALTLKSGEVRNVWIDAQSFLEIKMDGVPRRMDGKPRAVTTWFRDYKPVGGLMIPHQVETRVEGVRDGQRILVEQVALNPTLDNRHFTKPD